MRITTIAVISLVILGTSLLGAMAVAEITGNQDPDTQETQLSEQERTHLKGMQFTIGDIRYQVYGANTRQEIGERISGTLMGEKPKGKFLVTNIAVKNQGNKIITVRESSLKLKINQTTYNPDSKATTHMKKGLTYRQIKPGKTKQINVAYDVPESATTDTMTLQIKPTKIYPKTRPHYVNLSGIK